MSGGNLLVEALENSRSDAILRIQASRCLTLSENASQVRTCAVGNLLVEWHTWVWLKIKGSEGQTAGFGPRFHLGSFPGQPILVPVF